MTALEVTKSNVGTAAVSFGFTKAKAAAIAHAVGGLTTCNGLTATACLDAC